MPLCRKKQNDEVAGHKDDISETVSHIFQSGEVAIQKRNGGATGNGHNQEG